MPLPRKRRIFIIAGEASGDVLGAKLLESLRYMRGDTLEFVGVGGECMEAQGFHSLFPMRDLALMGFAEVLPHSWKLLCRLKETCEAALEAQPDLIVTIDSPGFNFRFVKWVRRCFGRNIPCVHYVAPTVWAYRPERAKHTAELFDHLITLLPFEPRYFKVHGLPTTFVGHPIVDDLHHTYAPPAIWERGKPLKLALFPGSRKGEIQKLLPVFRDTVTHLQTVYPDLRVAMPITEMMLPHVQVRDWPVTPSLVVGQQSRLKTIRESHVALAKTGTVTLEVAKYGLPLVATYKVNPLTAMAVKRMLHIPYVNLMNIIAGREVVPELLQKRCEPTELSVALQDLIEDPQACMEQSQASLKALEVMQNPHGIMASDAAAEIVLSYLK